MSVVRTAYFYDRFDFGIVMLTVRIKEKFTTENTPNGTINPSEQSQTT